MKRSFIDRAILTGLIGLVIGVIFSAVLNLISPAENLVRTVVLVCLAAFCAAFTGYVLGARQKK